MKVLKSLRPFLIALCSFALYWVLYRPPMDPADSEFVTALITALSMLGWSGMIFHLQAKHKTASILYLSLPLMVMILLNVWCAGYITGPHLGATGVYLFAALFLYYFTTSHIRYQERKKSQ